MSSVIRGGDNRETGKHPAQIAIASTLRETRQSESHTANVAQIVDNHNVSITPRSKESMILLLVTWCGEYSVAEENMIFALRRSGLECGIPKYNNTINNRGIQPVSICYHQNRDSTLESVHFHYLDFPGTTRPLNYALRFAHTSSGTLYSNGCVNASTGGAYERGCSTITAMEILL